MNKYLKRIIFCLLSGVLYSLIMFGIDCITDDVKSVANYIISGCIFSVVYFFLIPYVLKIGKGKVYTVNKSDAEEIISERKDGE